MTTIAEYRTFWQFNYMMPCPTMSEKCKCGRRIARRVNTTITCGKCGHTVLSYSKLQYSS